MKWNWGTGIVISLLLFGAFVIYLVYGSMSQRIDLVADDYYQQEVEYQKRIDQSKNSALLKGTVALKRQGAELLISFPEDFEGLPIQGFIHCYRPSDARLDFKTDFDSMDREQRIDLDRFIPGKWLIKIEYTAEGKMYYFEDSIWL